MYATKRRQKTGTPGNGKGSHTTAIPATIQPPPGLSSPLQGCSRIPPISPSSVSQASGSGKAPVGTSGNPSKRHRERLNSELDGLAALLPFSTTVTSKLDKLSVLRLSVAYLQAKTHFGMCLQKQVWNLYYTPGSGFQGSECLVNMEETLFRALGGFLLVISESGEIFYTSSNIEKYLGFHQSDILHQPVFDLVHSEDRTSMRQQLNFANVTAQTLQYEFSGERMFTARFRCLLDNTCGFLRLEIQGFVSMLHGLPNCYLSTRPDPTVPVMGLVALCTPLVPPLSPDPHDSPPVLLKSKHSLDLRMNSADHRCRDILNISESDLPASFYSFVHSDDLTFLVQTHNEVIKTGAAGLLVYRVYPRKSCKVIWLQTSGRLFYKNGKPDSIASTHRVLSEAEGFSLLSKRSSLAPALCFEDSLNPAKFPLAQSLFSSAVLSQQKLRMKRYRATSLRPSAAGPAAVVPSIIGPGAVMGGAVEPPQIQFQVPAPTPTYATLPSSYASFGALSAIPSGGDKLQYAEFLGAAPMVPAESHTPKCESDTASNFKRPQAGANVEDNLGSPKKRQKANDTQTTAYFNDRHGDQVRLGGEAKFCETGMSSLEIRGVPAQYSEMTPNSVCGVGIDYRDEKVGAIVATSYSDVSNETNVTTEKQSGALDDGGKAHGVLWNKAVGLGVETEQSRPLITEVTHALMGQWC